MRRRPIAEPRSPRFTESPRPIGARALKSARDTLRPYLYGARVLDLFAGLGRFGIAALEEEAELVVFVEANPATAAELDRALRRYRDRARVRAQDVFAALAATPAPDERYGIVFADPPFPDWKPEFAARLLTAVCPWLDPDGIFLVKHPSRVVAFETSEIAAHGLRPWKSVPFGESRLSYWNAGSPADIVP